MNERITISEMTEKYLSLESNQKKAFRDSIGAYSKDKIGDFSKKNINKLFSKYKAQLTGRASSFSEVTNQEFVALVDPNTQKLFEDVRDKPVKKPKEYKSGICFELQYNKNIDLDKFDEPDEDCILISIKKSSDPKNDVVFQIAFANTGLVFTRTSSTEANGVWKPWKELLAYPKAENNQRSRQAEESNPSPSQTSPNKNTDSKRIVLYRQPGNSWTSIGGIKSLFFDAESPRYNDHFVGPDNSKGMEKVYSIDSNGLGEPIIAPEDGMLEVSALVHTPLYKSQVPIIAYAEIIVGMDVARKRSIVPSAIDTEFQEKNIPIKKHQEIKLRLSKMLSIDNEDYVYDLRNLTFTLVKNQ